MNTLMTNRPERVELSGWEYAKSTLDKCLTPADSQNLEWHPATVPGTVASELLRGQSINYDSVLPLDDDDFWYRGKVVLPTDMPGSVQLHLDGLATFAEVWLDDKLVLRTDNMFCAHVLDVSKHVQEAGVEHFLSIRFCGLSPFLAQKHPRAKWRTAFVQHRNLRFVRTSLVGRTPGISPQIPVVGPWRPVYFELRQAPSLSVTRLNAMLVENIGVIDVELSVRGTEGLEAGDRLSLRCGDCTTELTLESTMDEVLIASGRLEIDKPELWWPHTHGAPHTYDIAIDGTVGGRDVSHNHKGIGFRTIEFKDPFAICVNGLEIFCRGACWRPIDFLSMNPDPDEMRRVLDLAVDAGMNMLRITGETAYETDTFYSLCDELGIMVWQDFMFARLDYPVEDENFLSSITIEAAQLLRRLSTHPCLTMLCGNTEVAQTAALLGLDKEKWSNRWFDQSLPSLCQELLPAVPYWRSSPDGGDMPFYTDEGASHYFGVGAYRQELADAVVNAPVFASECLAFGIPRLGSLDKSIDVQAQVSTPADANASWSFGDVTEYYALQRFGSDLTEMKESNIDRYHLLCGIAVGEVMYDVQSQWRRKGIACNGALHIALNDAADGNGWGLLDSRGNPKAPYFFLKRAWKPLALMIVDQGVNGLKLVVHNDRPEEFVGTLKLSFCRLDGVVVHGGELDLTLAARSTLELSAEHVIGHFMDSSYTYRFGARAFDYIIGELAGAQGDLVGETFVLSDESLILPAQKIELEVDVIEQKNGSLHLELLASRFVQSLTLESDGFNVSDNCFHLAPNRPKTIQAIPSRSAGKFQLTARGSNMNNSVVAPASIATRRIQVSG
ncbi:MAG: hypothetical protein NXH95_00270 [Pseudomonadaceae bacterium]|nr:hypothetical protein [Pseudomonadaceae bacterium]